MVRPTRLAGPLRALRRAGPLVAGLAATLATLAADDRISDLYVYSVVDGLVSGGAVPYRDFDFEYPPLALGPLLLGGGSEAAWTAIAAVALAAMQLAAPSRRAAWLLVLVPLLAGALVRTKFDLVPAAFAVGGLTLLLRARPAWAGAVLGLGTLVKLWPALLVGVAVVWLRDRRALVHAGAAAATVLAGCLPFLVLGGFPGALLHFHLDRPVQLESSPASVLFALGDSYVTGAPVRPDPFKSNGLDGGPAGAVRTAFVVLEVLALAGIAALVARRRDGDALLLGALGAVLAFVGLGAVLSPQYLLWLLPLAALVAARGHVVPAALVAGAAVLTRLWFPGRYFDLVFERGAVAELVAVRNLLLLGALAATARALARSPSRAAARRPPG
ncbi:glycosyltransferase 87 family protein [Conexibacter sp. SYSU D00693]|uniref:glycosyltransferase 87 family protein n=1 Tax=Conexibacter sp. SYSU D00693 TaxID=2812560 RepID=UPI00196A72C1|nr:glycosyltransferase 87 family protein [Conexibacter sp. SYSU D00693]